VPGLYARLFNGIIYSYMPLPRVVFQSVPFQLEIDWMYGFLFYNKWGWEKRILKVHPNLQEIYKYSKEVERKKFLKNYISDFRARNKTKIDEKVAFHQKNWQKMEKQYLAILSEIIETPWPKEGKQIKALVSINPICPRFINDWSFFFNYNASLKSGREIIMHEICHFLYFKKWKEIFPKTNKKKFDYPYLEWHLSELLAPVILSDPRIQKLLNKKPDFYKEHEVIKIGNKSAPKYFADRYKGIVLQNCSFEDFLKESFTAAQGIADKLGI